MDTAKLRGVNLGGWLVLERWITPSLFGDSDAQDEYSLLQEPGAVERVEWHRQTFVTEADFRWLATSGVNAVRIPVGYWIFDGDGPFTAHIQYLDWAINMAEKYGLKVLIDLHALKGSQNGKDHSGRIGKSDWFNSVEYQQETILVLKRLAERYRDSPALWGIEIINEPSLGPVKYFVLKRFYRQAYRELSAILRPGTHIVFSDAFWPRLMSGMVEPNSTHPVVMAVHWYQFGKADLGKYFVKLSKRPLGIAKLQRRQPVVISEWSGMISHLTLEGVPDDKQRDIERRHIEQQLKAYQGAAGWFYWTYKTEGSGIWSFREQIEAGLTFD